MRKLAPSNVVIRPLKERVMVVTAALAWNVHQPGVTSAIAGSRNADHVRANAAAGDLVLDAPTLAEIGALLDATDLTTA